MTDYHPQQGLTEWAGDVRSLIAEMKRRAGVSTDSQLASFMRVGQSTVAYWRKRGSVPEATVLRFERRLADAQDESPSRAMVSRMIAIRLAEFWYCKARERGAKGSRVIFFGSVALQFHTIADMVFKQLAIYEEETGSGAWELAETLMEDDAFLSGLLATVRSTPADAALAREARSPPSVVQDESPQSSPQSRRPGAPGADSTEEID